MKLLNKVLITVGCCFFSIHFAFLIVALTLCYSIKAIYCKIYNKGDIKINPFSYVNADVLNSTMNVLALDGFRIDTHDFLTEDLCTLTLWRVVNLKQPVSQPYPIFLQHGLLDCSVSWFLQQNKNNSLPYILSNLGFDVWIGNNRGTKYSCNEKKRQGYWDYTFDELVKFDVPTFINGILKTTSAEKIIYIGHSQGTSQLLAHLSEENQQVSEKIHAFIGLGPVISLRDVKNHPVINLAAKMPLLELYSLLGFQSFLHIPSWLSKCVGVLMYNFKAYINIFLHIVNLLCGYPQANKIDLDKFGTIIAHEPGGASVNNLKHWIQLARSNEFKKFDFGIKKNRTVYGSDCPPSYNFNNLKQFSFNKYLFRGMKDAVMSEQDFNFLLSNLDTNSTFSYQLSDYAHLDYIWGTCAREVLYENILKIIVKQSILKVEEELISAKSELVNEETSSESELAVC